MKKYIALILAVLMSLTLFAACSDKENNDGKNGGKQKLVIGMTLYEPICYKDENNELTGFDVEFAKMVAEKLNIELEFKEIDWGTKIEALKSKTIDCIWNGMTITDEITKNADVSAPYLKNSQIIVMKDTDLEKYKTIDSMKDLKFVAESESAGQGAIKANGLDKNFKPVETQTDALVAVLSGAADACVVDKTLALAVTGEGASYESLGTGAVLQEELFGIAFRKGDPMAEKVNKVIDELKADGSLKKLADKYNLTVAD